MHRPESAEARVSVRRSLAWTLLAQLAFFAFQFGSTIILARLLAPREMGIFAIAAAATSLVTVVQALGINNYIIGSASIDRTALSTAFTINLILSLILSVVIWLIGSASGYLLGDAGAARVMTWLAITPLVNALGMVPTSLLQREGNFKTLSILKIAATAIGTSTTVVFAFAGGSYMSLAYGWVVTCSISSLGSCLLAPHHVHLKIGLGHWRQIGGFGATMIVVNGTTQAQKQMLGIVMGRLLGLEALGLYTRGNGLVTNLYENLHSVAMRVFLVDFAQAARRKEALADRYRKVVELTTSVLWPMFAGLAVLSAPAVHILYGNRWHAVALPMSILCISAMCWVAIAMAWEIFVVAGETGRQARVEVIRNTVGLAMFAIGCLVSLNAAAAARVGEAVLALFLYWPHIKRITGTHTKDLLPGYARSGMLTAAAIAPALLLMFAYDWSPVTPWQWVLASILLGIVCYAAAMHVMDHPLIVEAKRLWRRFARVSRAA